MIIYGKDNRMQSNQTVIKVSNLKKSYEDVQAVNPCYVSVSPVKSPLGSMTRTQLQDIL